MAAFGTDLAAHLAAGQESDDIAAPRLHLAHGRLDTGLFDKKTPSLRGSQAVEKLYEICLSEHGRTPNSNKSV
jgi:hypothetical protein